MTARPGIGPTLRLHLREALLQQTSAPQRSLAFAEYLQYRVVIEHRLALVVKLGIRQPQYVRRAKT